MSSRYTLTIVWDSECLKWRAEVREGALWIDTGYFVTKPQARRWFRTNYASVR